MPKDKIQQMLQKKIEYKIKLENDWQNFLKKDTYILFKKFFMAYLTEFRILYNLEELYLKLDLSFF